MPGWSAVHIAKGDLPDLRTLLEDLEDIPGVAVLHAQSGDAYVEWPDNCSKLPEVTSLCEYGDAPTCHRRRTGYPVHEKAEESLYAYQKAGVKFLLDAGGGLLCDEMGLGKGLVHGTPVLTDVGWRPIEELAVGDRVVDPVGGLAAVTGVYPQGEQFLYRVIFSDGTYVDTDASHQWLVQSAQHRYRGHPGVVKSTQELFTNSLWVEDNRGHATRKWFIPVCAPTPGRREHYAIEGCAGQGIHPYVLGALLGDGYFAKSGSISITSADPWIIRAIDELGYSVHCQPATEGSTAPTYGVRELSEQSRCLELAGCRSWEKRIPEFYFELAPELRLELLRGLMDTDGDCTKKGVAVFNTSSPHLRDQVLTLVRGLGGVASVSVKKRPKYTHKEEVREGREAYRVNVRLPVNPFSLPKKAKRWRLPILVRGIEAIELLPDVLPTTCIAVDSKQNTFVTKDYIVTHNTRQALITSWMHQQKTGLPVFIVAPRYTRESWRRELMTLGMIDEPDELWVLEGRKATRPQWHAPFWFSHYEILKDWASTLNLAPKRNAAIIFDEAHWLKNGRSKRGKAAAFLRTRTNTIFALTGTPMANRPSELWNILQTIQGPKSWGSPIEFRRRYSGAYRTDFGWQDGGATMVDELRTRLESVYLRRTKAEVGLELPSLVRSPAYVDFSDAERKRHDKAVQGMGMDELLRFIESGAGSKRTLELMTKLRKMTSKAKISVTADIATGMLDQGESVLVFAWQRETVNKLAALIRDRRKKGKIEGEVFSVHGGETDAYRVQSIGAFREISGPSALVATLDSLKEGVTLTKANHVIMHDLAWRPTDLLQGEARIHRIGQEKMCVSHWVMVKDSIDTLFARAFCTKAELMKETLGISAVDTMAQQLGFAAAGQTATQGWMSQEAENLIQGWRD